MARNTPAVLAFLNAIRLSIVAASATRPSKNLWKSSEGEEQVYGFECTRSHVFWI